MHMCVHVFYAREYNFLLFLPDSVPDKVLMPLSCIRVAVIYCTSCSTTKQTISVVHPHNKAALPFFVKKIFHHVPQFRSIKRTCCSLRPTSFLSFSMLPPIHPSPISGREGVPAALPRALEPAGLPRCPGLHPPGACILPLPMHAACTHPSHPPRACILPLPLHSTCTHKSHTVHAPTACCPP